ncbi:MAG: hypothetical protein OHK0045_19170 [Raineya sp.]
MKSLIYSLIAAAGAIFAFNSCLTKPDFAFEPQISFASLSKKSILDGNNQLIEDSIFLEINFKDGDGDIGLSNADTLGKFAFRNPDKTLNPFYFNFYCDIYRQNKFTGEYERVRFPLSRDPVLGIDVESNIYGRVPPLLENARKGPIEGVLRYNIGGLFYDVLGINKRDSIRFEVFIYDRALNKSNVITTPAILVNE